MTQKLDDAAFAICIDNDGYPASLERCKVYRLMPDPKAAEHRMVRVIDESGEDYLYPEARFVKLEIPRQARAAFPPATAA